MDEVASSTTGVDSLVETDFTSIAQMLSSVQGMVEKTRQSMAILKERVTTTQIEMERKEVREILDAIS